MNTIDRIQREVIHAKSIGEYDYAQDLQFIIDFANNKLTEKVLNHTKVKSIEDCAAWVGVSLKAFEY